jgi:hypothetical protein
MYICHEVRYRTIWHTYTLSYLFIRGDDYMYICHEVRYRTIWHTYTLSYLFIRLSYNLPLYGEQKSYQFHLRRCEDFT